MRTHLAGSPIPAFDLAVWLFRTREWPTSISAEHVRDALFTEFGITESERKALFELAIPKLADMWMSETPISADMLLEAIGVPPGELPTTSDTLELLELTHIGPADSFKYDAAPRLNIITGDNSLGKTFLLECLWRVCSGEWSGISILPNKQPGRKQPKISFQYVTGGKKRTRREIVFNAEKQSWSGAAVKMPMPGLAAYARFDGSFAVWDPAREQLANGSKLQGVSGHAFFSRGQVWDGLRIQSDAGDRWLCNGLIRDWVTWQTGGRRYEDRFELSLSACEKFLHRRVRP